MGEAWGTKRASWMLEAGLMCAIGMLALTVVAPAPAAASSASAGQLYAFGDNRFGQLGSDVAVGAGPNPTQATLPGTGGNVVRAAAGEDHSLVVTSSGLLYAFGWNSSGQLGIAARTSDRGAAERPWSCRINPGTINEPYVRSSLSAKHHTETHG